MRLTSEIFAAAMTRRVFADGGFAAVARRGAEAAGAVFIAVRGRDGALRFYAPAPQTLAEPDGERRFTLEPEGDEAALNARLEREARFDPDFWVIEIETETPERYVSIV